MGSTSYDISGALRRCIGLGLDCRSQPFVECRDGITRGVGGLTLNIRFDAAGDAADALFDLAAEVSGRARDAVFIHRNYPSVDPSRHLSALLVSDPT
jgi:hypothetical protein